jgi:hypothetical protein
MKYSLVKLSVLAVVLLLSSCIEPFSPPEVNSDGKHLVVDGFLSVGDTSKIELRHTQNTNDQTTFTVEANARLSVLSENGQVFPFSEKGNGVYLLPPVNLNGNVKYRLSIKTSNGNEYMSEYVSVINTPPIDSITYEYDGGRDAMVIKVNTHDATNNTRFYRWKFEETYQYRAAFFSSLMLNKKNNAIEYRSDDVNLCWRTQRSANILLGSTIKLSADIIRELPINIVPISTNKFYLRYSILVKQYGLSREGFEYWTDLAKSTQGTGSLFDPQPSQVTGNIKSTTNPKELVFGYFSASRQSVKRIFMSPGRGRPATCMPPDTLSIADARKHVGELLNFHGEMSEFVLATSGVCADCRTQGGTNIKPAFWE